MISLEISSCPSSTSLNYHNKNQEGNVQNQQQEQEQELQQHEQQEQDQHSETTPLFTSINQQHNNQQWKDGLFDCFRYGYCHVTIWNALCCPQILMAQVLTRLNMTWLGDDNNIVVDDDVIVNNDCHNQLTVNNDTIHHRIRNRWKQFTTFHRILLIVCIYFVLTIILSPPTILENEIQQQEEAVVILVPSQVLYNNTSDVNNNHNQNQSSTSTMIETKPIRIQQQSFHIYYHIRSFLHNFISWIIGLYTFIVLLKLRRAIRKRYNILPNNNNNNNNCCYYSSDDWEDCCISCWCGCCSVTQMARQTCDYEEVQPSCCSDTGWREKIHTKNSKSTTPMD